MMQVNKVCNVEDFRDPQMADLVRAVFPHEVSKAADYPIGFEHRKAWEVALAYHVMRTHITRKNSRVLGVGAGRETTIYLMTNFAEVHATDLYADAGIWHQAAPSDMLLDPARCAPAGIDWQPEKLIVQHMDGCKLRYPDGHFDAVFSSSSIEHFGSLDDIARAAREIGRVLRPGGIATISTEFKITGPDGHGWDGVMVFDEKTLHQYVIEPSGLELIEPLDTTISESTLASGYPLVNAVTDYQNGKEPPRPHIVMTHQGYVFSSVHIALRKAKEA
jgi:SAM-dependent methyltransferase